MAIDTSYQLEDRYRRTAGRVYLTGTQALVRLPLVQHQRDLATGLKTAGFVSGYPGSPLGQYDGALHQARAFLAEHDIHFQPGLNEDLAATAVWGSQFASRMPGMRYDGVFSIWYGKGPGVDRSIDAIKHGAWMGASPRGGVLVLAGDDHGARSSTMAHQSDFAFVHCAMPILHPATVQEYLDYGIYGWAMSRFTGSWIGFKCVTDVIESGASVSIDPDRVSVVLPEVAVPDGGLTLNPMRYAFAAEALQYQYRHPAAQAFVRANRLDRMVMGGDRRRLGIVTTGKAYLDVRAALDALGIDAGRAAQLGLAVYKVAMPWPLEPLGALEFAEGCEELLVIEEKRPILEEQLARLLVNRSVRPRLVGKTDETGAPLVQAGGELAPEGVAKAIAARLLALVDAPDMAERARPRTALGVAAAPATRLMRLPAFCSGCPHNTSTRLPEGSFAFGGIGCHGMAMTMPDRRTLAVTQMGGEGAGWIGIAPFVDTPHLFQNLGDGTYFHSGLLAIRAAVASGVNITYKILANGAIAMTGGQAIQGGVAAPEIARQVAAEGAAKVVVVTDDPKRWEGYELPPGVTVHPRIELDRIQRELREIRGTTAIVYEQECAAEKRRKRKRGTYPEPDLRVVINERVCEGCGDCSVQSNCISVEPVETEFGRKRRINQSSCNKDYSCLLGYCPSFVTVRGARLRGTAAALPALPDAAVAALPTPTVAASQTPCSVLVAGIGGTGVVTVGALLGMAAHLEGKGVTALDVAGLAQKNGPVTSHVRVFDRPDEVHATRIEVGGADLVIGADIVVSSSPECIAKIAAGRTALVVNDHVTPTAEFARNPDLDLSSAGMRSALELAAGGGSFFPATELAEALMGDAVYTNIMLMGFAAQRGRLPVSVGALERAIELNGVSVDANRRAFVWGRLAAHDLASVEAIADAAIHDRTHEPAGAESLDQLVSRRAADLTEYQDAAYARRYRAWVDRVRAVEAERVPGHDELSKAVARYLHKLMAYKDEYEVARLMGDPAFWRGLEEQFEGDLRVEFHLALQIFDRRDGDTGRARKRVYGPSMRRVFALLAKGKRLRGTPLDVFGRTAHRRIERALIGEYETTIDELLGSLSAGNHELAVEIASIPEHIRGYDLVKEAHLRSAKAREAELLEKFRREPNA
ncbi:MAG TPA: indolepyruvate ferredoxin oxidoreductase family protein [Myxococcota bacterium]|nr:indolepyruvate ferredoxin oxidoreductase family protein [Myxococcota bacterium]